MHKQEYCCFGLLWTSRTLIPYHSLITFLCASIKSGQESQTASGAWGGGGGGGGDWEEKVRKTRRTERTLQKSKQKETSLDFYYTCFFLNNLIKRRYFFENKNYYENVKY